MTTSVKVCNFSCSCVRDDCSFKHRIDDIELRKEFKKIVDAKFDKNSHNETDPDGVRHIPCLHGFLCGKEDCGYKHRCSFVGRKLIIAEWNKAHPRERKELSTDGMKKLEELASLEGMSVKQMLNSYLHQKE
jgi:hypothetical protein